MRKFNSVQRKIYHLETQHFFFYSVVGKKIKIMRRAKKKRDRERDREGERIDNRISSMDDSDIGFFR